MCVLFTVLYSIDIGSHALSGDDTVCRVREERLAHLLAVLTASYDIFIALSDVRGFDVWYIHDYNVGHTTECHTERSNGAFGSIYTHVQVLTMFIYLCRALSN